MENVGDGLMVQPANWRFSGEVVKNFDEHVSKSVPLYREGHDVVCEISDFFIKPDSICYEFGCSTGALTLKLARHNAAKSAARFIGVDIEQDMIDAAKAKAAGSGLNTEFTADDVLQMSLEPTDLIVAYYTIQFVRPSMRQGLIDRIYQSLNWGGAFLLFEKVRGADARFQDILSRLYDEYKLKQGYSPDEILGKARSLKGVLEPFSEQGNLDMLRRAGFVDINPVMRYLSFAGYLAIK